MYRWFVSFSIFEQPVPGGPFGEQVGLSEGFEVETIRPDADRAEELARAEWKAVGFRFAKFANYVDGKPLGDYPNISLRNHS